MGGGNDGEALLAYADAVRELWPDLEFWKFAEAMQYGLSNVKWFGKLTVPAMAEFIRAYEKHSRTQTEKFYVK